MYAIYNMKVCKYVSVYDTDMNMDTPQIHMHTCVLACMHAFRHAEKHQYIHTHSHGHAHTLTAHTHTDTHTHLHTLTHTHTHITHRR